MMPETFEPLSFGDRILVARIHLCSAAIALLLAGFWLQGSDWPMRVVPFLGAAGLIYLARQLEPMFRLLDGPVGADNPEDSLCIHYLFPF